MSTALEFLKLEKVAFGGVSGHSLNIQLKAIQESFDQNYKMFADKSYDTLDPLNEEFTADYAKFCAVVKDLDYRLANIFGRAMDDCLSAEHLLKLSYDNHSTGTGNILSDALYYQKGKSSVDIARNQSLLVLYGQCQTLLLIKSTCSISKDHSN
ncbi:hypothetical protein X801_08015 [Opisthorchis viverrini]|uniref:Dynein heavy chain tail domain-containing protein n=1 Tax=Opisthorchis viverrini TaxID=6198 RepID=A0A1S8WP40_OPIVI|nr:hypothetical protein X801_08015 [Opisthorchis viverrini]